MMSISRRASLTLFFALILLPSLLNASERVLLLDKNMNNRQLASAGARPWIAAGCTVEYRQYLPYLINSDVEKYDVLILLSGSSPAQARNTPSRQGGPRTGSPDLDIKFIEGPNYELTNIM